MIVMFDGIIEFQLFWPDHAGWIIPIRSIGLRMTVGDRQFSRAKSLLSVVDVVAQTESRFIVCGVYRRTTDWIKPPASW